jgi:putative transposase
MDYPVTWPQFFTASMHKRLHLLKLNAYKEIIISSLQFLTYSERIELNAFAIMSNHVHFIWQPMKHYSLSQIQSSFMRHTAKQILNKLYRENSEFLDKLKVNKYDRKFQVWKRQPLSIELFNSKVFMQKLEYIHNNPVSAQIVALPESYKYSSARYYETGEDEFNILTHYSG